jgi:uncharacterized protein (TIGR00369 family)
MSPSSELPPRGTAPASSAVTTASVQDPARGFSVKIPFVRHLGFALEKFEGGHSDIRYTPLPDHLNSFDVVHGGAVMTLLDVSMATAARSAREEMGVVTIEMKTSFMRPSRGELLAKGELMHATASMAFTQATIYDAKGNACAHATGTFKYVRRQASPPGLSGNISTD